MIASVPHRTSAQLMPASTSTSLANGKVPGSYAQSGSSQLPPVSVLSQACAAPQAGRSEQGCS
jgi:hypothetical protein